MASFPDQLGPGAFVSTTNVWEVSEIYSTDVTTPAFKELLVRLHQNINNISLSLNIKDSGYYTLTEFVNGQAFFPNPALNSNTPLSPVFRQVFRKVVNFGALPNTAVKAVAHNITFPVPNTITFTRMCATASDTVGTNYIPIPYASSVAADNIELEVDAVNVYITTGINRSNFTICYVVLEYIKS